MTLLQSPYGKVVFALTCTAALFFAISEHIDVKHQLSILASIPTTVMMSVVFILGVTTLAVDVASFGRCYRLYLVPSLSLRRIFQLRGSVLIAIAILPMLAPLITLQVFRRQGIALTRTIHVETYVTLIDIYANLVLVLIALSLTPLMSDFPLLLIGLSVPVMCLSPFLLHQLARTLCGEGVTWRPIFSLACIRFLLCAAHTICIGALLPLFHIDINLPQLLILSPLLVASAFIPLSTGGYGGPQGVAILMLVEMWEATHIDIAIAFSLLWSTLFLVARVVCGFTAIATTTPGSIFKRPLHRLST